MSKNVKYKGMAYTSSCGFWSNNINTGTKGSTDAKGSEFHKAQTSLQLTCMNIGGGESLSTEEPAGLKFRKLN